MDADDEEWRLTQYMMRAIGERMLVAGWVSRILDTPNGTAVEYTGRGIDRMNALASILIELDLDTLRTEHAVGLMHLMAARRESNPPKEG